VLNHPPYAASDLKDPPLAGDAFIQLLKRQRAEKYPDPPPFYQALFDGSASREALELWVKNSYYYWDHAQQFSTGAIFIKTNEEATRTHMLHKLVCIEGREIVNDLVGWTTPAYEELWLQFGESLGLTRDAITSWKPFTRSYFAISTLCLCSRWWEWSWLDGVASFYAGDQLQSELVRRSRDALKQHYGVSDEHLEFFRVVPNDLDEDLPWEEACLAEWACTTERQLTAARAFRYRLDIEYQNVQPLATALKGEALPLQVP
jgi:pyrroloquinoline quinone (PQQ) biosynthesis protein C